MRLTHQTNASNGKLCWTAKTGAEITGLPAYANEVVYAGSTVNHLFAFNAKTGATLLSVGESNQFAASPAVSNGVISIGNLNGSIYVFNAATGTIFWSAATGPASLTGIFSPAIAGGIVYVCSNITDIGSEITAFKLPA